MRIRIVQIGNSQGIRIPKALLEQTGLKGEIDLIEKNGSLVIRPAKSPRKGWAEAFQEMARNGEDELLDDPRTLQSDWDKEEWEW